MGSADSVGTVAIEDEDVKSESERPVEEGSSRSLVLRRREDLERWYC